ncbi:MAG TPA: SDR family NAD(P)-dependent oxidoreductase [Haloferula sp.]
MIESPLTLRGVGGLVVITGGEGGLGRALHAAFEKAGHAVLAPGRRELDVTDLEGVRDFFRQHEPELLVCNAGITRDAPVSRLDETAWDEVMSVNLRGAARCAAAASRSMLRARRGHIVFISSFSALHPPVGQVAYASAKAALIGLSKSLARELGPAGIRVNTILPGFLDTPMTAGLSESRREQVRRDHALGQFNTPDAVAAFLAHLHGHLPHTSGQVFQLDSRIG